MKHLSIAMLALSLSAGAALAADAPSKAQIDACLRHADAYNSAAPGTAKFNGAATANVAWMGPGAGDNFRLQIDSGGGGTDLSCTVSPDGRRISLEPLNG
ncbi:hypothetical protein SAZ10_21125 [Mesorhizobium sp. BAC0120]|uniref:hypothetical protein n=1 Tax=Mesorhizobium sp. BAC0120 TaxID=3090670 RepID=UPI00298D1B97|nr:hypothetical protein [Mesorhizobium sp. BAC0120]MDW6024256.1 hypothetical protein [Mesorhizobium sp. BAC0120]